MTMAYHEIPDPSDRAHLNADLVETGTETGFWDEHGSPAPWPDDIDDWRPVIDHQPNPDPAEPPF